LISTLEKEYPYQNASGDKKTRVTLANGGKAGFFLQVNGANFNSEARGRVQQEKETQAALEATLEENALAAEQMSEKKAFR